MKKQMKWIYLTLSFALILGLLNIAPQKTFAADGDTETINMDTITPYKFNALTGGYIPIFVVENSQSGKNEFAFCVEFPDPVNNSTDYDGAELVTGSANSRPFHPKVMAIQKFVNTNNAIQTVRDSLNNQNLNVYQMLMAAQLVIWEHTDDKNYSNVASSTSTFTIEDFLDLVPGNTYTLQQNTVAGIYNYFKNTLPDAVDNSTPFAEIEDISVEWNFNNSEFTIYYRVEGANANGAPFNPTTKYYVNGAESAELKALEQTVTRNGQSYYAVTLPSSYATSSISVEASGEQIYTGYYAVLVDGVQDVGGYTENKRVPFKDVESITIPTAPAIVYGEFTISKTSSPDNVPLAGVQFTLTHVETGTTYVQTTNADGIAYFSGLYLGNYTIEETSTPSTHTPAPIENNTFELTKDNATSLPVLNLVNERIPEKPVDPKDPDESENPDDTEKPEEPSTPTTPTQPTLPQTNGQSSNMALIGALMLLASAYIVRRKFKF